MNTNRIKTVYKAAVCLLMLIAWHVNAYAGDKLTTVADKGTSGQYYAKYHATTKCSIDSENDQVKVYSIYVDAGKAFFAHVRLYDGKYNINAGDNIVIKTDEAHEVEIVEASFANSKRSVVWDDVICLAADQPKTSYVAANLSEGEYLYLLTNMADNGGFGFTSFGGTMMRAGNFFIKSTAAPASSGRLKVVWLDENGNVEEESDVTAIESFSEHEKEANGVVYTLQGQRVAAPAKPGLYIINGRKTIVR